MDSKLYCTFSNCLTPTSYDFNGQTDGQSIENISALVVSFAHTNLNSMAVSVFASEKPLVGAGYAISIHLSINGPRKSTLTLHCLQFQCWSLIFLLE